MKRSLWLGLCVTGGAVALMVVAYFILRGDYATVTVEIFRPWTSIEDVTLRLGDALSGASWIVLGVTFFAGLVHIQRATVNSRSLHLPALLMLVVGIITAVASVISIYGLVRVSDVSALLVAWGALHEVLLRLGVATFLSAALIAVVILKENRAS